MLTLETGNRGLNRLTTRRSEQHSVGWQCHGVTIYKGVTIEGSLRSVTFKSVHLLKMSGEPELEQVLARIDQKPPKSGKK